jgi:hypothetical protein
MTSILLMPTLRGSGALYNWLSFFQVLRMYRVVLAFSIVRKLTIPLVVHLCSLFDLISYMMLCSLLAALLATQLFWSQPPLSENFLEADSLADPSTTYGALSSMYRAAVSETWTDVLFDAVHHDTKWYSACISVAFFFAWFVIMNLIIPSMFIATVHEIFYLNDDQMRLQQVRRFLRQTELEHVTPIIYDFFNRWDNKSPGKAASGVSSSDMMLRDSVMRDFLDDVDDSDDEAQDSGEPAETSAARSNTGSVRRLVDVWNEGRKRLFDLEPNPFYSGIHFTKPVEDLAPSALAKEVVEITETQTIAQRRYLLRHPHYDTAVWLFPQGSRIRKLCQRAVQPGRDHTRYQGVAPSPGLCLLFSITGYMLIISMVVIACIATPQYQKEYFAVHGYSRKNWFVFAELGFASVFTMEALIRIVADGFFLTPNAYLYSFWGVTDGVAILSMWIDAYFLLQSPEYATKSISALKALEVLRLFEIKDKTIRDHTSAFISGR